MAIRPWTADDVPDQSGRTAVVTGANTGLGLITARVLAQHGAAVVMACRDTGKAAAAAERVRAAAPGAAVSVLGLDLASLDSVRQAAERLRDGHERIDLLVNNAGRLGPAQRGTTVDGFEVTMGTNHLGVFALTGLVLDRLLAVPGSRVVTVASVTHRSARLDLEDLQSTRGYRRNTVYGRTKLANLLFTHALDRRLSTASGPTIAVAAHPGISRTDFVRDESPILRALYTRPARLLTSRVLQDGETGALATVRAAVDPGVRGGEHYGPSGFREFTGPPVRVTSSAASHDVATQERLWAASEELTGVRYPVAAPTGRTSTGPAIDAHGGGA